jgi:excisionase family DNA binding protein
MTIQTNKRGARKADVKSKQDHGRLMTVKQAAKWLGLSPWNIRSRIDAGDLPIVRFHGGRKIYLDVNDLEKLVEKNKVYF